MSLSFLRQSAESRASGTGSADDADIQHKAKGKNINMHKKCMALIMIMTILPQETRELPERGLTCACWESWISLGKRKTEDVSWQLRKTGTEGR